MPLYEFGCPAGHLTEVLRPASYTRHVCACGLVAQRRPARVVQLNPPTGAALRSHYRFFQEASQEIDHAHTKVEADIGHPVSSPNLWEIAKTRAHNIAAAGEAPTSRNPFE